MYCMACNKIVEGTDLIAEFIRKNEQGEVVAKFFGHACNPDNLSKEKLEKYKKFPEEHPEFCRDGHVFFGMIAE